MAASTPRDHVEMTETLSTMSHFSEEPKTSNQLSSLPLPRRRSVFRVGGLVAVVFVLALLSAMITCSQVFKKRVTGPHENMGRRLAAEGEKEEEEEGDLLAQILLECIGWKEGQEERAGGDTRPQEAPTFPQTSTYQELPYSETATVFPELSQEIPQASTSASQAFTAQPLGGQIVPDESRPLGEPHYFPSDQSQLTELESLESTLSPLPYPLPSPEPFSPEDWQLFFETYSPDATTPQHAEQPSPLMTGTKRSPSELLFGDSPESKRQKVMSTQSPQTSPELLPGLPPLQQFTATTQQQHQQPWSGQASHPIVHPSMSPEAQFDSPEEDFPTISPPSQQDESTEPGPSSLVAPVAPSPSVSQGQLSTIRLPPPAPLMPPSTHPYYRLPFLQPGRICRTFSAKEAFTLRSRRSPSDILLTMRRLLAQPSITPSEADTLITCCEQLTRHLHGYHIVPLTQKRPCFVAASLARRFIFLEAMFCSIQVVGSPMRAETWWPQLLQMIPTDYEPSPLCRSSIGTRLAQRLSAALASLKNGIRPSLEDTVELKRELFKGQSLKLGFDKKLWDPWRKDDDGHPDSQGL
ncbi:hypothetical protein Emed_003324 [Eimeria media]